MLNINGIEWKVVLVPPNHPILQRDNGYWTLGACSNDTKTIYISDTLSNEKLKKVLCHEITHASMFSYQITLTLDQEELLADLLASYGAEIVEKTNKIFRIIQKK